MWKLCDVEVSVCMNEILLEHSNSTQPQHLFHVVYGCLCSTQQSEMVAAWLYDPQAPNIYYPALCWQSSPAPTLVYKVEKDWHQIVIKFK